MQGSLGEKIGEGAMADVHAWAPGQVVKLFKVGTRRRVPWFEARMTHAVFAAGGPATEVLGEVTLDDRHGIVLPRLDGPTLLQLWHAAAMPPQEAGEILAALALSVHDTPPPPDILSLRVYMEASLESSGDRLPKHVATGVLALIERLPLGERLCHCDIHPGNVIITAAGPRLVDWTGTKRGDAALDLACSHFLLTELVPESLGERERQRALDAAMQSEYARLAGISPVALAAAVKAHLPIVSAFFLLGAAPRPATRERLLQRLEADMRSQEA